MEKVRVSFIIPAYNAGKYLAQCLDSVLSQTISKEIIVIDDGSTDSTPLILKEYSEKYNCITIITKENGGQSIARNIGIQKARGEYLCFLDSDDYYISDFAFDFYEKCIKYRLDILRGWYARVYVDGKQIPASYMVSYINQPMLSYDFLKSSTKQHAVEVVPVTGFMKREFIMENALTFPEGYFYEDQLFYLKLLLCQKPCKIMQTDCCFYAYRMHCESVTHTFTLKKFTDLLEIIDQQYALIRKRNLKHRYQRAAYRVCSLTMCHLISVYLRLSAWDQRSACHYVTFRLKIRSLMFADNAKVFAKISAFIFLPALLNKIYQKKEGENDKA